MRNYDDLLLGLPDPITSGMVIIESRKEIPWRFEQAPPVHIDKQVNQIIPHKKLNKRGKFKRSSKG